MPSDSVNSWKSITPLPSISASCQKRFKRFWGKSDLPQTACAKNEFPRHLGGFFGGSRFWQNHVESGAIKFLARFLSLFIWARWSELKTKHVWTRTTGNTWLCRWVVQLDRRSSHGSNGEKRCITNVASTKNMTHTHTQINTCIYIQVISGIYLWAILQKKKLVNKKHSSQHNHLPSSDVSQSASSRYGNSKAHASSPRTLENQSPQSYENWMLICVVMQR